MNELKKIKVLSGNFATGDGNKGNYNAYDKHSERFFVPKRLMESNGWLKDEDVKFPFYANATVKAIGVLDADGEPLTENGVAVTRDRLQVVSIYKTREEMVADYIDDASLDIDIAAGIQKAASAAGLTAAQMQKAVVTGI